MYMKLKKLDRLFSKWSIYAWEIASSQYCFPWLWFIKQAFDVVGYEEDKSLLMSQRSYEKKFGQSSVFVASTFYEEGGVPPSAPPASLLKEAIHVISCGYEDKTEWGKEVNASIIYTYIHTYMLHTCTHMHTCCPPAYPPTQCMHLRSLVWKLL